MKVIYLPDPPNTRRCESIDDFGDVLTIGKYLKRRNFDPNEDDQFAIYLGLNKVGIKSIEVNWKIIKKIQYSSSEEMHKEWILD